ncbi:MAG: hypothetical protein M1812_000529 [Candelaria pacifica]|nr:MAG: hypothetical protein M1812_000529 [Candelaria pacifica]
MAPKASTILTGTAAIGMLAVTYQADLLPNPFRTTAVASIEDRYSSGGGTDTHTPGVATPTGYPKNVTAKTDKQKGVGSEGFKEKIGGQKPDVSCLFLIPCVRTNDGWLSGV